jgi:methyl-accepting chemotaxis protein
MNFKNLKIRSKLLLGFIAVILVLVVIGIIAYHGLNTIGTQLDEIATNRLPSIDALHNINEGQAAIKVAERDLLIVNYPTSNFREGEFKHIDDAWKRIEENWKIYLSTAQTPEEKTAWDKFVISWNEWKELHQKYLTLCKEEDKLIAQLETNKDPEINRERVKLNEKAKITNNDIRPFFYKAETDLNKLIKINEDIANELQVSAGKLVNTQNELLLGFIGGGIVLALVIAFFIASLISVPVRKIEMAASLISEGNLEINLDIDSKDEIGSLATAFKKLITSNKEIVEKTKLISNGDLTVTLTKRSEND